MVGLLGRIEKFKAKRAGVRIRNIDIISSRSHLVMEEHSRLGNVSVRLPKPDRALRIGAYSYMREDGQIWNVDSIGRFCSIGRNVVLGQPPNNHPVDWVSSSNAVCKNYVADCNYTSIGNDVWIAHDAVVMAGVTIGNGAVIGRNAIVTKDVEPYQIVVGNPGRVVRKRFSETQIAGLLGSSWWNIDYSVLTRLPFDDVDTFLHELQAGHEEACYKTISIWKKKVSLAI